MTPVLWAVYDELVERAAAPPVEPRARAWTLEFLERTGHFPSDHACAQYRLAAAWEDALCRGGFARELLPSLTDAAEKSLALLLTRAHRGIFQFDFVAGHQTVHDLWSGASFLLVARDDIGREVPGDNLGGICQGRVVAAADGCAILPGVVFHSADATGDIHRVLQVAAERQLDTDSICDALLRMDHALRTLSRVRASYAYRPEALKLGSDSTN